MGFIIDKKQGIGNGKVIIKPDGINNTNQDIKATCTFKVRGNNKAIVTLIHKRSSNVKLYCEVEPSSISSTGGEVIVTYWGERGSVKFTDDIKLGTTEDSSIDVDLSQSSPTINSEGKLQVTLTFPSNNTSDIRKWGGFAYYDDPDTGRITSQSTYVYQEYYNPVPKEVHLRLAPGFESIEYNTDIKILDSFFVRGEDNIINPQTIILEYWLEYEDGTTGTNDLDLISELPTDVSNGGVLSLDSANRLIDDIEVDGKIIKAVRQIIDDLPRNTKYSESIHYLFKAKYQGTTSLETSLKMSIQEKQIYSWDRYVQLRLINRGDNPIALPGSVNDLGNPSLGGVGRGELVYYYKINNGNLLRGSHIINTGPVGIPISYDPIKGRLLFNHTTSDDTLTINIGFNTDFYYIRTKSDIYPAKGEFYGYYSIHQNFFTIRYSGFDGTGNIYMLQGNELVTGVTVNYKNPRIVLDDDGINEHLVQPMLEVTLEAPNITKDITITNNNNEPSNFNPL